MRSADSMISWRFLSAEGLLRFVEDVLLLVLPDNPVPSITGTPRPHTMMTIYSLETQYHSYCKESRTLLLGP